MFNYLIRVQLPDRPGALGAVASRIGSVGGDVVSIEILQRDEGMVVDELGVGLGGDHLIDLLRDEILEVDGVVIESVRPVDGALPDRHTELLEVATELFKQDSSTGLLEHLTARVCRSLAANFAAVLDTDAGKVAASEGDLPDPDALTAMALQAMSPPPDALEEDGTVATAFLVSADLILVVGRTAAGLSLFGVKGDADGLTRTPLATMDQTRKQARLEFADTPAWLIGVDGAAAPGLSKTLDLAAVALAAEQVGGAQRCLDSSVEYAKTRIQFGRPIGSFQAIKHKCADMLLEVESAKSAAYYAGWAAAEDSDELPVVASLAKSYCSEAYFHAAAETIQIHGGIGFTWEHPAHLYFKRAKSSELMLGDPSYHRELLAQRIGI